MVMSELGTSPPALPPPPPPRPAAARFDFAKPFTFAFEDPDWVRKVLVGGLFYLAAFLIIGIFFLLGYCARLFRNVVARDERPLPEWQDLGEYFSEGVTLAAIGFVYMIPLILLIGAVMVPAVIAGAAGGENMGAMTGGLSGCLYCLLLPIELAFGVWLPAALTFAVVERRFGAAFEFSRIWNYIRTNAANYALAIVVYFVASFAAQLGMILLCVGLLFTGFLAMVIATHAFAQVYRESAVH